MFIPFAMQFKDLFKCVCLSVVKGSSKEICEEICEEISFPSFFIKILMSAFLFRIRLIISKKCVVTIFFLQWIPIALVKICVFLVVLTWRKNLCIQQTPSFIEVELACTKFVLVSEISGKRRSSESVGTCLIVIVSQATYFSLFFKCSVLNCVESWLGIVLSQLVEQFRIL